MLFVPYFFYICDKQTKELSTGMVHSIVYTQPSAPHVFSPWAADGAAGSNNCVIVTNNCITLIITVFINDYLKIYYLFVHYYRIYY